MNIHDPKKVNAFFKQAMRDTVPFPKPVSNALPTTITTLGTPHHFKTGDKVNVTGQDRKFVNVTGPDSFELCFRGELPPPKFESTKQPPRRWKKRKR